LLIEQGVGRETIDAVVRRIGSLPLPAMPVCVDLGSGSGDTLGALAAAVPATAIGIDLSVPAVTLAARKFPALTWVVANADRRLPLLDGSIDLVLSVHARRNPAECHRVLGPSGVLVVAVPGADDLIELREAVQGAAVARDRVDGAVAEHGRHFTLVDRSTARQQAELSREGLLQLLRGTYRGARVAASARVAGLGTMTVTLSSDIIVLAPRIQI
jgi:23S rRNA (guanine745-N1)-methyltransferase